MLATFLLFLITSLNLALSQQSPAATTPAPPQSTQPQPAKPQPCANANTQIEFNECFANLYEAVDAQLNVEYNKVVAAMKKNLTQAQHDNATDQVTHNETALAKLLTAQRAWLAYRDANCDSVKFQYEGGSIQPMIWSQCMADTTQQRIATLTTAYDISN
jgi:uncharacterized protein YecT (DUF1311 family)